MPGRRLTLTRVLASAGVLALTPHRALCASEIVVRNVTGLYPVAVSRVVVPRSSPEVCEAVRGWPGKVAIGGGRYSMGGQVAIAGGLHLDMRAMKRVLWIAVDQRRARVQAGITWRDLQDALDPLDLSVKTMQSYANFTVGGAVSVNAHGRYVGNGPVGNTVLALRLVLADGRLVDASRQQHAELFRAAIGGYGAIGVITEVELELADNVRMERTVVEVPLEGYLEHFDRAVLGDDSSILHNADLMPPRFDLPVSVTWRATDRAATVPDRLVARGKRYALEKSVMWAMTELPRGDRLRKSLIHPLLAAQPAVEWRNHEASLDVAELEPRSRRTSTYALQEYFIPRRRFLSFARALPAALARNKVRAVNVSLRHSPADTLAVLPWAKEEVISFVLYYKQGTAPAERARIERWTRKLIDLALDHEGRYYLPYQLHATREQFHRAYPESELLRQVKAEVDPTGRFSNEMWAKYLLG